MQGLDLVAYFGGVLEILGLGRGAHFLLELFNQGLDPARQKQLDLSHGFGIGLGIGLAHTRGVATSHGVVQAGVAAPAHGQPGVFAQGKDPVD